jgi:hypothetical protein
VDEPNSGREPTKSYSAAIPVFGQIAPVSRAHHMCPAWVKRRHWEVAEQGPLHPRKRTSLDTIVMSALCRKQTIAVTGGPGAPEYCILTRYAAVRRRARRQTIPSLRHMGGVTPSRPTSATVASMVPLALFAHAGMNILAPGFRSAFSPGIKLTTIASDGTTIVFSPSLYFSVSVFPSCFVTC